MSVLVHRSDKRSGPARHGNWTLHFHMFHQIFDVASQFRIFSIDFVVPSTASAKRGLERRFVTFVSFDGHRLQFPLQRLMKSVEMSPHSSIQKAGIRRV